MDRNYQLGGNNMKRDEWEFEYTAKTLATAAEAQRDFRKGREKAWEDKKGEIMVKIKESGLTVHEGVSASMSSYSNSTQGLQGATVMVDATLQKDLNECVAKIRAHGDLAREYDSWAQVLNANPESRLRLTVDDWMYFFGK